METYALAPNIFKPRNDWNLVSLKCKKNNRPIKSFVEYMAHVIEEEIGVSPFSEINYRGHSYVIARQLLMVMLLRYTNKKLHEVGKIAGNKEHATVIHARKTINNLCDTDKKFNELFCRVNNEVLNYLKPF
jgi:hypothetical protein